MKKYILEIILNENNFIKLKLLTGDENQSAEDFRIVDGFEWDDQGQTSQNLLKQIDIFLQKNNLQVKNLLKVRTTISNKQKFTLARIIQITAETINYCLKTDRRGKV